MKKIILLLLTTSVIIIFSCKKKSEDPKPIDNESQGGYNDNGPEPEKPTIQLKQLIARNIQTGNGNSDSFISFTYNSDGFVESVLVETNKQTGEKLTKTLNTLTYESKTKISGAKYIQVLFNTDASKNDTTWVTTTIIYEVDKIILKKSKTYTQHGAGLPTKTYDDQEKDFIYIQLDGKNRMTKWWNNYGQVQEFEYDEIGNCIKSYTISKYNNYYLYHQYDKNNNPLKGAIISFFSQIISTGINSSFFIYNSNPTVLNISDTNPQGIGYNYIYNENGYPIKITPGLNNNNPMTLEYIY